MKILRTGTAVLVALLILGGALVVSAQKPPPGRIGPSNRIQPSGRKLNPVGKLTRLGNLTVGGALTPNGRFLWTVSGGRGPNDVRIVRIAGKGKKVGRVIQVLPMPGASGGIVMSPDKKTVYVSGTPETTDEANQTAEDTPGKEGDVIHVFEYVKSGKAKRTGVIEVPPPDNAPPIQTFPPTETSRYSWPRDLAISPDGKTLLAALNLADHAAVIDTASKEVTYVATGRYPYGAAILNDGVTGLVSNEADGTVSVIDLAGGSETQEITVGPHLSHPEGIAVDPKAPRAYVAVTHQDLIAVVNTETFEVERTLSVERPEGIGTAPVHVSVTADGCRLLSADSGEDAIAVFALPGEKCATARANAASVRADRILRHEGKRGLELAESEAEERAEMFGEEAEEEAEEALEKRPVAAQADDFKLLGRVPIASYPVASLTTSGKKPKLVWLSAKGLGVGSNTTGATQYLPELVNGMSGIVKFPSAKKLRKLTPRSSRQLRPTNTKPPPRTRPSRTTAR